jgi:hypothetical protein
MSGFLSDIIAGGKTGELTKLKIISFTDADQTKDKLVFEAYYNPTSFTSTYAIGYDEKAAIGNDSYEMKYRDYSPVSFSLDLLLDGTGSSLPTGIKDETHGGKSGPLKVDDRIEYFLQVAHTIDGNAHRPRYLLLIWGDTLVANVVLTGLVITKELFDANGKTLRAKLACSFKEYSPVDKAKAKAKLSSPDMTHVRTVQQGDKLPLMCERIYGDARLYLQVARYNGLTNYRNLQPGQTIYFPPLVASKS